MAAGVPPPGGDVLRLSLRRPCPSPRLEVMLTGVRKGEVVQVAVEWHAQRPGR